MNNSLFKPHTQMNVLRRYLHIIGLLQNPDADQVLNSRTIADILETEDPSVTNKIIRDYIVNIETDLDIAIDRSQGVRHLGIAEDVDDATMLDLLRAYSSFIVSDSHRDTILRVLMQRKPGSAMGLLSRLHFAIQNRSIITFMYTNAAGVLKQQSVNPYFLCFRSNALYLVGKHVKHQTVRSFLVNRIEKLQVTDTVHEDAIPSPESVFGNSFGASFDPAGVTELTIRYRHSVRNRIEDAIIALDAFIHDEPEWITATFRASDVRTVCKHLFILGKDAELLQPESAREVMRSMISEIHSLYSGPAENV